MVSIQEYIDKMYPSFSRRAEIRELDLGNKGITGHFSLKELGFTNLIYLNYAGNEINSADTHDLDGLLSLSISFNQIINLEVPRPLPKLVYLHCSFNQLNSLEMDNFPNLCFLDCSNNPFTDLGFVNENKDKLAYFCHSENGKEKTYVRFLEDKNLRMKVWEFHRDVESQYNDRLAKGIMQLVDISDLDSWVENYDISKKGDIDYHKILGKEVGFTELNWSSLENLATKILARCLIAQNRLINKKWEKKIKEESEKEMRTYVMRPMNNNFLTSDIQKVVDEEINRKGKESVEAGSLGIIDESRDWRSIHLNFSDKRLVEKWLNYDFTYKQTEKWIKGGLNPIDADYALWLRDKLEIDPEWLLSYRNDKLLRDEYEKYMLEKGLSASKSNNGAEESVEKQNELSFHVEYSSK